MLWIKAFHIIFMVIWFSGLFYLPRIFVYHAMSQDPTMNERFGLMERKLYYYVMNPSAALTVLLGAALIYLNPDVFLHACWMQIKIGLVLFLLAYHFYLDTLLRGFQNKKNRHSHRFYRWVNEVPSLFLVVIVVLVVVKPLI